MTRKHFVLIAKTVADLDIPRTNRLKVAQRFAETLAATNPNFNRYIFVQACMEIPTPKGA
tara:strand:- start:300 stop:479 length:180 start_codon:yes stop_codon:yes gene_type:complete